MKRFELIALVIILAAIAVYFTGCSSVSPADQARALQIRHCITHTRAAIWPNRVIWPDGIPPHCKRL